MDELVTIFINEQPFRVPRACVVSAALARAGLAHTRRSVSGEPRGALCGMGVCFECRITIDGQPQLRGCQRTCEDGMKLVTDE